MAHSRKKNRRRKVLSTVLILLAILIAGAALGVRFLRQRVTEAYGAKSTDEVKTVAVTRGSISTTITGSGTLSAQESAEVTLPQSVALRSLCAAEGDLVAEGDVLAYLDLTSVLTAMNERQTQLEALDESIAQAAKDAVGTTVKATVTGRVKGIFCQAGDSVLSAMYEHGALLVLSLDGHMAVDIPRGSLSAGEAVQVTLSDDTLYPGTVGAVGAELATVLITDNKPLLGDTATVADEGGTVLGAGPLYIHQPLPITGYAGTVSRLAVGENTQVTKNRVLLYLSDTTYTANYDALLGERAALEEELSALIGLYTAGVLRAGTAGVVETISAEPETEEGETSDNWLVATIRPQEQMIVTASIDESNILSVELGQSASVTISSISEDPFTGVVTAMEKTGTSTSGVTGYAVEVTLDRTEKMLPRMSATVSIRIQGVDNALLLPEDAVTRTRDSAYVYTGRNETSGELEGMAEVKTGLTGGGYIEIIEGLQEGDTVYYTEKQATDFGSFMGGFSGSNRPSGSNGGSGSSRPSGSDRNRPSGSGRNGGQP